jgi:glutathione S-transferase
MSQIYTLHYAPDNASLIIRIALESLGVPYETVLVDRSVQAQSSAAYRAINPLGMIPALETDEGVIFETGAILLWLADRHDALFPEPNDPARGDALKWIFFISNSLHTGLRQMFYPEKFICAEHVDNLRDGIAQRVCADFAQLEQVIADPDMQWLGGADLSLLDIYVCACLRWAQLYPQTYTRGWAQVHRYPSLLALAARVEKQAAVIKVQVAEGLGPTPFSAPIHPNPPEGSAT